MGNCCLKKGPLSKHAINHEVNYKTKNDWYKHCQKTLIKIMSDLKKKKNLFKILHQRQLLRNKIKTTDDIPKRNRLIKKKLQSEHIGKNNSSRMLKIGLDMQAMRDVKNEKNIWELIELNEIKKPDTLSIRNKEYKHIIRRQFDLVHWDVLLRIIQVNNKNDCNHNFNMLKNQIKIDYELKYNSIFKKKNFKGKTFILAHLKNSKKKIFTRTAFNHLVILNLIKK
jgi:hypothetical protein